MRHRCGNRFGCGTCSEKERRAGDFQDHFRDKSASIKYRYSTDSSGNTTYRDNSGNRKFTLEKGGTVWDNTGSMPPQSRTTEPYATHQGAPRGRFSTCGSNTTVRDSSGSVKYRIMKDGTIRNASGSLIGKIDKKVTAKFR